MNRIKHACAVLLFALGALPQLAQAANIVTYNFNQPLVEISSSITETLSLDLDAVANPANITLAELNAHATYTLSVTHGTGSFTDFDRTNADSIIKYARGKPIISVTATSLTFAKRPGVCILGDPDALTEAECDASGGVWDPTPQDFSLVFAKDPPPRG